MIAQLYLAAFFESTKYTNDTNEDVIVIEVQMGSYFGEDDIVRVSDL